LERAREIAKEIFERNAAGCCWHVVLHDGNTNDACIIFCWRAAQDSRHKACLALADLVPFLTRDDFEELSR